jgi:saccharopine dehydrogenase (NAD+, L-lysine-forming)
MPVGGGAHAEVCTRCHGIFAAPRAWARFWRAPDSAHDLERRFPTKQGGPSLMDFVRCSTCGREMERARFWMTFGDAYIQHLTVLQNVGMTRIDPVLYNGVEIIPLQFLKAVLPEPASLGPTTHGKTNNGDIATGEALDGSGEKTFYIYNICDHEDAYHETGNQAVSYTTGVPAMIGAAMMLTGAWRGEGVFNMEQFDPDPFLEMLGEQGLPWQVKELGGPLGF